MLDIQQRSQIDLLIKKVGDFQIQNQSKVIASDIEEKSFNQLVSYVDIESEKMLVAGLKSITPEAGFLIEEKTSNHQNEDLYWIIDPLDGTTNYLFGHTKYSISIALYQNKKPVYAHVFVPPDNESFVANQEGAFLNGERIIVSKRNQMSKTLIATGFPYYKFDQMEAYTNCLKILMKETKGIRRMGSAAIDLAYTACGRFDAFYELNLSPWDVAGGAYIVQQAGGIVSDFKNEGNYVFGNSILAGNPDIHLEMLRLIKKEFS
jgi:myo-inositol-1(or 4)-monophosphatase